MKSKDKNIDLKLQEKLFLEMESEDLEIRLTKLEQLLEDLKKADEEKEAV